MTIEETIKQFIEDVNAEFGSDLAIDSQGGDGEISINWPGHGHIYVDAKTGDIKGINGLRACHKYLADNHIEFNVTNNVLTGKLTNIDSVPTL